MDFRLFGPEYEGVKTLTPTQVTKRAGVPLPIAWAFGFIWYLPHGRVVWDFVGTFNLESTATTAKPSNTSGTINDYSSLCLQVLKKNSGFHPYHFHGQILGLIRMSQSS